MTLVGKGVCFDTGGLDLKTAAGMRLMKKDMGGAATVLGLAEAIMEARLPVRLRVLVPAVENAVSGNAFRPLDIIRTRKGITVEIGNTDAEGRLILCDALAEADAEKPALLIDMATLTGAARVALGPELPALFCNDDALAAELLARRRRRPPTRCGGCRCGGPIARCSTARSPTSTTSRNRRLPARSPPRSTCRNSSPGDALGAYRHLWLEPAATGPGRPEGGEALGLRALYHLIEERFGAAAA